MKKIHKIIICVVVIMIIISVFVYSKSGVKNYEWIKDIGYKNSEINKLKFQFFGKRAIPEVPILLNNKEYLVTFDTGCNSGLALTTEVKKDLEYKVISKVEQLNRDGSHRGWSEKINLKNMTVYDKSYSDIQTVLLDWRMLSSNKFNGVVGLKYFKDKIITLDYEGKKIGVTERILDYKKLKDNGYVIIPLEKSIDCHYSNLIFFRAQLDGKDITVYLDTGKNHSFYFDSKSTNKIGGNVKDKKNVNLKIGEMDLKLNGLSVVGNIAQIKGLSYPTMIELNSDQIWKNKLIVTIDLKEDNIIFKRR